MSRKIKFALSLYERTNSNSRTQVVKKNHTFKIILYDTFKSIFKKKIDFHTRTNDYESIIIIKVKYFN